MIFVDIYDDVYRRQISPPCLGSRQIILNKIHLMTYWLLSYTPSPFLTGSSLPAYHISLATNSDRKRLFWLLELSLLFFFFFFFFFFQVQHMCPFWVYCLQSSHSVQMPKFLTVVVHVIIIDQGWLHFRLLPSYSRCSVKLVYST